MIVVDTNIVAYLWLNSTQTLTVRQLAETDPEWLVPKLWKSEFRNVLAAYLRRNLISLEDSIWIALEAEDQLSKYEFDIDSQEILKLVNESTCSAYDCEFIALSQTLGLPLITYDAKILAEFPSIAMTAQRYLDQIKK